MTQDAPTTRREGAARGARLDLAVLRVLAILGVITIHVSGDPFTNDRLRGTAVWWVAEVLNSSSRFCVPLFVMVSGALVLRPGAAGPAGDFLRKRLDRLVPAMLVWYAVYALFKATVLDAPSGPSVVLTEFLTGRTYTGLYFFWLILGLYLLTPALSAALARLSASQLLAAGVGLTALTCLWRSTLGLVAGSTDVSASPTAFTYWLPYVGYYVLGAALARARVDRRQGGLALGVAALATLGTVWISSGSAPALLGKAIPTGYQSWLVALATAALFVGVSGLLPPGSERGSVGERLVVRLGSLTLGVFAGHLLVLYALEHSGVMTVTRGASRLLELAYLGVGTVVGSFVLAWALSRVPGLRRLV